VSIRLSLFWASLQRPRYWPSPDEAEAVGRFQEIGEFACTLLDEAPKASRRALLFGIAAVEAVASPARCICPPGGPRGGRTGLARHRAILKGRDWGGGGGLALPNVCEDHLSHD
jgi:hypothetical protein